MSGRNRFLPAETQPWLLLCWRRIWSRSSPLNTTTIRIGKWWNTPPSGWWPGRGAPPEGDSTHGIRLQGHRLERVNSGERRSEGVGWVGDWEWESATPPDIGEVGDGCPNEYHLQSSGNHSAAPSNHECSGHVSPNRWRGGLSGGSTVDARRIYIVV